MAGFLQGLAGAGVGAVTGGPWGALTGFLGGVTGSGQHEDPQMKRMREFQQGLANQMQGYAQSVPGSSPDELANMAQARGVLGQQQRQADQRVMGAYNPNQGLPQAQMLANLSNAHIAQQMAQQSGFLQDAAMNRRKALMDAASLGQGAASLYKPQQSQLGPMLGQLSQALAYRQKQQELGQHDGTTQASPGLTSDLGKLGIGGTHSNLPPGYFTGGYDGSNHGSGNLGGMGGGGMQPGLNPLFGQNPYFQKQGDDPQMTALMQMLMRMQQQQGQGQPGGQPGMGDDPMMTQMMMSQGQPMPQQQVQGQQGMNAPGNEPGGMNSVNNAVRQSNGLARYVTLPNGVRLPY